MYFAYNNETIQVHIIRSKRKTVCMSVNKDGSVTVKAPLRYPTDKEISDFVEQKIDWVLKQREIHEDREDMRLVRRFETDYSFPYLGEERLVEMQRGKKNEFSYENGKIVIKTPFYSALENDYEAEENKVMAAIIEKEVKQKEFEKFMEEYRLANPEFDLTISSKVDVK